MSKVGAEALTLVLPDAWVKGVRVQAAERLAKFADGLLPRPSAEEPMYLVALAVAIAADSDDAITDVYERLLRRVDGRTVGLMFLSLVDELAKSEPSGDARPLGYSPASSAAWARRRLNRLMGERLGAELDA